MEKKKVYPLKDNLDTGMRYAVLAKADRLKKHRHAWKAWRALKDFGCKTYLVAPDIDRFEGIKVYPALTDLPDQIDVVVPCLRSDYLENLVQDCAAIQAKAIWFQENNWTPELDEQCREQGIQVVRGCVLKHRIYEKPWAFLNPCYWHGRQEVKVADKYQIKKWR